MSKSQAIGMSYENFLNYQGSKKEIAISMLSKTEKDYMLFDEHNRNQRLNQYKDYLKLNIDDIEKPVQGQRLCTIGDIDNVIEFVRKYPNKNVVVHCNSGVSRTGAIIYLLHKLNYQDNQKWIVKNNYIRSQKYVPNRYMVSLIESVVM